jgi:hypothetical protein
VAIQREVHLGYYPIVTPVRGRGKKKRTHGDLGSWVLLFRRPASLG